MEERWRPGLRILHGTIEIAGQMGILSGEQKRRGHWAVGYNIFHSYLGYRDHLINTVAHEIARTHHHMLHFFDLFHFHYGSSLLEDNADLPAIARLGKKMVMHHWGNDVRFHDVARRNNPYVYTGDSPPNEVIRERLTRLSRYIKHAIVQDYEVYEYVAPYYEQVHVVPIAIDLTAFPPEHQSAARSKPLVLHAPTNPDFKGTSHVENAIAELQKTHDFEYRRIQQLSHTQAIQLYREADIIIDQVRCGSYGLLSVETMALGKPVIAYIRDDLLSRFPPELPVYNANPDNLGQRLRELLENPALRHDLGARGRQYVEKYHAKEVVVQKLESIYASL
jgi:hypothetical protein